MRVAACVLSLLLLSGGCATAPPAAPAPPVDVSLDGAVKRMVADLAQQLAPQSATPRTLVIDPLLDGRTGQQTLASQRAQQQLERVLPGALANVSLLPFDAAGARQSLWVLTGTLTTVDGASGQYRLTAALADRRSGLVIARAIVGVLEPKLDLSPTRFYADSPSLVRDRSVEGYLRTSEAAVGQPADALYLDQIPTAGLLTEAQAAYQDGRWEDALRLFTAAVERKDGEQLRTFNGLYLANNQLGRSAAAEAAFGKIAMLGLATNNLAVKLLFRPGSTDFWADVRVAGVYPMWLRQVARAAVASGACLNVVGHTSRSGALTLNEKLSLARATAVRERLERESAALGKRLRASGVGFSENLVGTGADDASDALDRRVEFKVVPCSV